MHSVVLVRRARALAENFDECDAYFRRVVPRERVLHERARDLEGYHFERAADDAAEDVAVPQLRVRRGQLDKVCRGGEDGLRASGREGVSRGGLWRARAPATRHRAPASGLSARRSVHEFPSGLKASAVAVTPRNILNASRATVSMLSLNERHRTLRDFAQNSSMRRMPML